MAGSISDPGQTFNPAPGEGYISWPARLMAESGKSQGNF